ncbi:MAG TPA: nucleotidyltransferase [Candidatus Paceibacterota bacterium]|nr:nucleotidyltransferase [Candidatus Paceibacterota bacterium]
MISEEQINRWANPPSETESEKCTNAIKQITDALRDHFGDKISFIRQGSHRNNTNIRHDSDVDLAVLYSGSYFPGTGALTPADKQLYERHSSPAAYPYRKFKEDVNAVLQAKFGLANTQRKNKCIRVSGNSYRVNADVVPVFPYRRYKSYDVVEAEGIALVPDNSFDIIHSFPNQHYDNGVAKNNRTGKAFKSVVRIFKNVRNDLNDKKLLRGGDMPSFFIECLVWNVPDTYFDGKTYREDALAVADKIWDDMQNATLANQYAEVCDLRWLFKGSPHRTHERAKDFALQVWSHIRES